MISQNVPKTKKIDKRLISANFKNRKSNLKCTKPKSNVISSGGSQLNPNMDFSYSFSEKSWKQNDDMDRCKTHDNRKAGVLHFDNSNSAIRPDNDYATYTMYKKDENAMPTNQMINYLKQGFNYNISAPHTKPVVEAGNSVQKYVRRAPNKGINKKSVKGKWLLKH